MSYIKADSEGEQRMFDYLEELRKSGETNMFGASPYLQHDFGLGKKEAIAVLSKWMKLHSDPERLADKPISKVPRRPSRLVTRFEPAQDEN